MMNIGAITRGKHSKIRKIKEKYGEQDQEEREMRMKLMGTKEVKGFDLVKHQEYVHGQLINPKESSQKEDQSDL